MAIDAGLSWAFVGAGAFAQGVALLLLRRPLRLLRAGGSVVGTVEDSTQSLVQSSKGPAWTAHFAVVRFTTSRGESIRFESAVGKRKPYASGSPVRVLYDPARPQDAELATFASLWLFPFFTSLFGLPFLLLGLSGLL